jgi:hypothetical protein
MKKFTAKEMAASVEPQRIRAVVRRAILARAD